jgi:uncharacterized protein YbjT (DUF2867 family)
MYTIDWAHDLGRRILPGVAAMDAGPPDKEPIMYVVAGASGNTGKVVAETLLSQKKPVRVVLHDPSKAEAWRARGAEVAIAELDDAAALTQALKGATGAYLLLPPQMQSTDARKDNAARTAAIVKAVEASGVPHVVFLSSVAAHHASGTGPILSVHDAEKALRAVKADVTFVRASYFMENWGASLYALGQGALPTFLNADAKIPMVASRDIGTTAAKVLVEGGHGKSVIELSGPREYSPRDVAEALARLTGKPIALQVGPEEAMIPALTGAGLNAHWAGLYKEMTHGINTGRVAFEGGAARPMRGTTEIDVVLGQLVGKPAAH